MIDINEYLDVFYGAKASNKICEMESNEILLNSMPKIWSRQTYVQGFYCESTTLKYVNMFEHMEILESIYEGVVEPSYSKNY